MPFFDILRLLDLPTLYGSIFSLLLLLITVTYLLAPPERPPAINAPSLDESPAKQKRRYAWDTTNLIREAYEKFPNQIFQLWSSNGPEVMIPHNLIDEIKNLPDVVLNIYAGVAEDLQTKHTTMPMENSTGGITYVRKVLTRDLGKFIPGVQEELNYMLPSLFPPCPDWTPITPHPKMLSLIATLTTRILTGPHLCRSSKWIQTTISYSRDIFISASILKFFPPFIRPVAKYLIPQMWRIWRHNQVAASIVETVLTDNEEGVDMGDAIHYVQSLLPENRKTEFEYQGRVQLGLAAASIHTTAGLLTNAIYDLAAHPECVPILTEEMESELSVEKGGVTVDGLARCVHLDSFLTECLSLHAGVITTFRRILLQPLSLPSKNPTTTLQKGTYISLPSAAISVSPSLYPNPTTFLPFRFSSSALPGSQASKNQLTNISPSFLAFGIGKHACPGRFFAALETKLVLVELIRKFDFRLGEGGRPRDGLYQGLRVVGMEGAVEIRERRMECQLL